MSDTENSEPPPTQTSAFFSPADRLAGLIIGVAILLVVLIAVSHKTAPTSSASGAVTASSPRWVSDVREGLAKRGFDWITIDIVDGVAVVAGGAPDVDSRAYGFDAAKTALLRADQAGAVKVVADAIELDGGAPGVAAAVRALPATPSAADCQRAFDATLAAHAVAFVPDSAELTAENLPLLDALAAVALRCHAYRIEIGGHTQVAGKPAQNVKLSEQQAAAVQGYLFGKGVPATGLSAHGYGAEKPLDPARTPEADARNRRIAFTVAPS